MKTYLNTFGVSVGFEPWLSTGYRFASLQMYEEIGGKIASGRITIESSGSKEALKLLTDQKTADICVEKEGGKIIETTVQIVSKQFNENRVTLGFLCIPNLNFTTEYQDLVWPDPDDAIRNLWEGELDIRCNSDTGNGVEIRQNSMTRWEFCTKLATSWKQDTVFAYGWDGFMIKDVIGRSKSGEKEPVGMLLDGTDITRIDPLTYNHYAVLKRVPTNYWEKDGYEQSENFRTIRSSGSSFTVKKEYEKLLSNYWHNKRYTNTELYNSFRAVSTTVPNYGLGDTLEYRRNDSQIRIPFELFLVKSNELFIASEGTTLTDANGAKFSWTSKLIGLESQESEVLPTPEQDLYE